MLRIHAKPKRFPRSMALQAWQSMPSQLQHTCNVNHEENPDACRGNEMRYHQQPSNPRLRNCPQNHLEIINAAVCTIIVRTSFQLHAHVHCNASHLHQSNYLFSRNTVQPSDLAHCAVIIFFSSSPGANKPINFPRSPRRSLPIFFLRDSGLIFLLILCAVKIPLRKRFCRKNCLFSQTQKPRTSLN